METFSLPLQVSSCLKPDLGNPSPNLSDEGIHESNLKNAKTKVARDLPRPALIRVSFHEAGGYKKQEEVQHSLHVLCLRTSDRQIQ